MPIRNRYELLPIKGRLKVIVDGNTVTDTPRGTWNQTNFLSGQVSGSNGRDWHSRLGTQLVTGDMDVTAQRERVRLGTHARGLRSLSTGQRYESTMPSGIQTLSVSFPLAASKLAEADSQASRRFTRQIQSTRNALLAATLIESRSVASDLYGFSRTAVRFAQDVRANGLGVLRSYSWLNGVPYIKGTVNSRNRTARRVQINNVLDRLASSYLGLVFAYLPLFQDAAAVSKALTEQATVRTKRVRGSGAAVSGYQTQTYAAGGGYSGQAWMHLVNARETAAVKYLSFVSATRPSAAEQLGLLPRDFIPTVWEIVPWSWLIDYVSTSGSLVAWAGEWLFSSGSPLIQRTRVITQEATYRTEDRSYDFPGWAVIYNNHSSTEIDRTATWIRRDKVSRPSMPDFRPRSLTSPWQALNVAAVAKLRFLRADTIRQTRRIVHP